MPTVVCQGWLLKEGARVRNWKRRWFKLDNHDVLSYYKSETAKKAQGTIDITKVTTINAAKFCECQWPPEAIIELCFGLVTKKRTFHIVADSLEDMKSWMAPLRKSARLAIAVPVGNPLTEGIVEDGPQAVEVLRQRSFSLGKKPAGTKKKQSSSTDVKPKKVAPKRPSVEPNVTTVTTDKPNNASEGDNRESVISYSDIDSDDVDDDDEDAGDISFSPVQSNYEDSDGDNDSDDGDDDDDDHVEDERVTLEQPTDTQSCEQTFHVEQTPGHHAEENLERYDGDNITPSCNDPHKDPNNDNGSFHTHDDGLQQEEEEVEHQEQIEEPVTTKKVKRKRKQRFAKRADVGTDENAPQEKAVQHTNDIHPGYAEGNDSGDGQEVCTAKDERQALVDAIMDIGDPTRTHQEANDDLYGSESDSDAEEMTPEEIATAEAEKQQLIDRIKEIAIAAGQDVDDLYSEDSS